MHPSGASSIGLLLFRNSLVGPQLNCLEPSAHNQLIAGSSPAGATIAISPDTMAIHHILDKHVAGAPCWKDVARGVLHPSGRIDALAAHRAAFEQRYRTPRLTSGLPWICTWNCVLPVWPQPLSHLRQASLSEAVDKVVSYRCIAQRLGAEPMADREMGVGDQEQFCFSPRLLTVAQLRKRGSQKFA
jgi:hypothetical protein